MFTKSAKKKKKYTLYLCYEKVILTTKSSYKQNKKLDEIMLKVNYPNHKQVTIKVE